MDFEVDDTVRVYWREERQWFVGKVDQVNGNTWEVYYENDETWAEHNVKEHKIEKVAQNADGVVEDCPSSSDDDVPLITMKRRPAVAK